MKQLIVVRHAKSGWGDFGQKDIDRSLNDRGKKDAPEMGARLKKDGVQIDAFVSSPAKRAKKTCLAFVEAYGRDKDEVIYIDKLYHAPVAVFYETANNLDDKYDNVAVFSHNPGITEFVNSLTTMRIDNMPTCAAFSVKADIDHWKDFEGSEKQFVFFKYPKEG